MKKIIIIFYLSFSFFFTNVYSKNFNQTVKEYLNNNSGNTALIYAFDRCAAVLTFTATKFFDEPNKRERALNLLKLSTKSSEISAKIHSKHNNKNFNESLKISDKRMKKLDKLYRQDSEEYFNKNGRFLSPTLLDDLEYCTNQILTLVKSGY